MKFKAKICGQKKSPKRTILQGDGETVQEVKRADSILTEDWFSRFEASTGASRKSKMSDGSYVLELQSYFTVSADDRSSDTRKWWKVWRLLRYRKTTFINFLSLIVVQIGISNVTHIPVEQPSVACGTWVTFYCCCSIEDARFTYANHGGCDVPDWYGKSAERLNAYQLSQFLTFHVCE